MKRGIARKWIVALKSGNYTQTTSRLKKEGRYCVLGVLCDLYKKETGEARWEGSLFYGKEDKLASASELIQEVQEWAGIKTADGTYNGDTLMGQNDNGTSFVDLAKIIKEKVEKL